MKNKHRVLIIGADGADPSITARLMGQGALPRLADLCARGRWGALQTTFPPVSPVAWMTVLTGMRPSEHGISDFITKAENSYLPTIGLFNVQGGPNEIPRYSSRRSVPTLAERLSAAGRRAYILKVPATFPPMPANGGVLAGFGMPDLIGTFGVSAWYTTDPAGKQAAAPDGVELVQPLEMVGGGVWHGQIAGPAGSRQGFTLYGRDGGMALALDAGHGLADARLADARMAVGEWSPWLRLTFDLPNIGRMPGLCRFKLISAGPTVELYRTAVQCAPDRPLFPLSEPPEFAAQVQAQIGPFATLGMPSDLDGVRRGVVDADTFLQDAWANWTQQVEMTLRLIDTPDWDLIFTHLFVLDNVQHLFWHAHDTAHPAHTPASAQRYGKEIENAYRWLDEKIGQMVDAAGPDTTVLVVGDHGGLPIYRQVYLNAWLRDQGYLQPRQAEQTGQALKIDWDNTQAAMFGTGAIWLNLRGRDPRGTVWAQNYAALRHEIAQKLLAWRDPDSGRPVVKQVLTGEAVLGRRAQQHGPDLLVAFQPGYGLGRGEGLGRVMSGTPLITDNLTPWTGGHEGPYLPSDVSGLGVLCGPGIVPGPLPDGAALLDIAPTVLTLLGIQQAGLTGKSLAARP